VRLLAHQRFSLVLLLFLVGRVKDDLKFRCWDEPTQNSLVVVGVSAVAETSDDIALGFWQKPHDRPRGVVSIAQSFYHG